MTHMTLSNHRTLRSRRLLAGLVLALGAVAAAQAETPSQILDSYVKRAGAPASPERGQRLFTQRFTGKSSLFESCTDCHGTTPTKRGKDGVSEKAIEPLAPAANPKRLTDPNKVDNYLRINCKDVVGRDCSAQEKADVLAWLISLKP